MRERSRPLQIVSFDLGSTDMQEKKVGTQASLPRSITPRMHSTLRTSHFFNSFWTYTDSRNGMFLGALATVIELAGRGKKSMRSATPASRIYRVWRMLDEGRYCCFVVKEVPAGGAILNHPPRSLSSSLQKTEGESKSGLIEGQLLSRQIFGVRG